MLRKPQKIKVAGRGSAIAPLHWLLLRVATLALRKCLCRLFWIRSTTAACWCWIRVVYLDKETWACFPAGGQPPPPHAFVSFISTRFESLRFRLGTAPLAHFARPPIKTGVIHASNAFPCPSLSGWFFVHYSDDLRIGDVKTLRYFGQDLVLFRNEGGEAGMLDAYCPHLGAHLGAWRAGGGRQHSVPLSCLAVST